MSSVELDDSPGSTADSYPKVRILCNWAGIPVRQMCKAANETCDPSAEKAKVVYQQSYEEFRSLNRIMWQVPVLVMTFSGGLWFGIESADVGPFASVLLYGLVALGNAKFIGVLWRLRKGVMDPILDIIYAFEGRTREAGKYTVIRAFSWLMGTAAVASVVFAILNLVEAALSYAVLDVCGFSFRGLNTDYACVRRLPLI